ncbi:Ig-like domain-containing protein [Agrococcus sp. SL85]|uniref:Ig-like domain-containing protein n=1 Tax=Agrococcus sp. SL85 TaxID=2995141 RepID=UPI00226C9AFE|nr:Ig-like domain-containing protein [Agrococcus sp. SL85]WAC66772.1 Ig-like domain-containing protein [Agrococcus sp. SL85]
MLADATPTIAGLGEPGATMSVAVDGTPVGSTTVTGAGTWALDAPAALGDGAHNARATQTIAGTSTQSGLVSFTIDTAPPAPPVIVEPADGSTIADATPTFAGTGETGATVAVEVDGVAIGSAPVVGGAWSLPQPSALSDGAHTVTAIQTDPAGNASAPASSGFSIDATAPAPPVVEEPADGSATTDATPPIRGTAEAGSTVTVSIDGAAIGTVEAESSGAWSLQTVDALAEGAHAVSATATDALGNVSDAATNAFEVDRTAPEAPEIVAPADGSTTNDTTPTVSGTGEDGATVEVRMDGAAIGTVVVEGGSWTLPTVDALAEGAHVVSATQDDAAGNASEAASNAFEVDLTAPDAPSIVEPADGSRTSDTSPTVSGTGEPGATVDVAIDGAAVGTAAVSPGGGWSLELADALDEGDHIVSASQADPAGNASGAATSTFAVDVTAPAAPVILEPADGSRTNDTTPTVSGTGEAGAVVDVAIDGTAVGSGTVDADGSWSVEVVPALAPGERTVVAIQTDEAGNASAPAESAFVVDVVAPAPPAIESPADGSTVPTATPTISGAGEAGAAVEVAIDGDGVGTALVDGDGAWELALAAPLAEGGHIVSATQADEAGNVSDAATVSFVVDTVAPGAPAILAPQDGDVLADPQPEISGTGEADASIAVTVDGVEAGTTTVLPDGSWSLEPSTPLADGVRLIEAVQVDAAGNASAADGITVTVDTQAPEAPVIVEPADGSVLADSIPTITGTGEPGATVAVEVDGAPIGLAPVDEDGTWSLTPIASLADGDRTIAASQTDAAGNASGEAEVVVTIDTAAPDAPEILVPTDGALLGDPQPTVSGTGEAGATLSLSADGTEVDSTTVLDDGTWSLALPAPLADGEHTIAAVQRDAAGNASGSDRVDVVVDTGAPEPPVITAPVDGSVTNDPTPEIRGTGEAGAVVAVEIDGEPAGLAPVDGLGDWTLTPIAPLAEGERVVSATQTDGAGNASEAASVTVEVDLTAPAAPAIDAPVDGSVTNDTTPLVAGTGEPGATVTVLVDGAEAGTAPVDEAGEWSLQLVDALAEGERTIEATQTDVAGNGSGPASATVEIDLTDPEAPVIETPADGTVTNDTTPLVTGTGEPGATVLVVVDGAEVGTAPVDEVGDWSLQLVDALVEGERTIDATQADPASNASEAASVVVEIDLTPPGAPVIEAPVDGSVTNETTPEVSGTGEPGATVLVVVDGAEVGTAPVDDAGAWSLQLVDALAEGERLVEATQTDPAGNASEAASVTVEVDLTAPEAPVIEAPADGSVTNDTTPLVTGSGEPGAIVTVAVDGAEVGTAPVDDAGAWSLQLAEELVEGERLVEATQTDPAGNASEAAAVAFEVDLTAPEAPVIEAPADGSVTNDATPLVTGSGEPGAIVTVAVDGAEVGTAPVDDAGAWSLQLVDGLVEGERLVEATQTDPASNASEAASVAFEVDLTAPEAPVIEAPADGSVTNDATPLVTGTGEPGATATVFVDGTEVGTAPVDGAGDWSLQLVDELAEGEHLVEASQADPAGNVSDADAIAFEVDRTADAAPSIEAPVDGSVTGDTTPVVSGSGAAGSTVTVEVDGVEAGTAPVDGDGRWSLQLVDELAEAEHVVEATQSDPAGNVSEADAIAFEIDLTAPEAPVIEVPADGSTIGSPTPTVSGSGEPGATVQVTVDGAVVGSAPVLGDGSWAVPVTTPLDEGEHTAEATQADPSGNASEAATSSFTVDLTAPDAPVIEAPADGSTIGDATPTVTGTGELRAVVAVSVDGAEAGVATVLDDGTWALPLVTPLAEGERTATATQTDPAGNASGAASSTFEVDLTAPDAPVIETPADGAVLADAQPTVGGAGEPGSTVTVTVDGVEVGTAPVEPDGTWTLPLPAPLAEGEHVIGATQTDAAGNGSEADSATILIDLTAPEAPSIEAPVDGVVLADPRPTVRGTGEPGATVAVLVDGSPVGTAPVDGEGAWTLPLAAPLADGERTIGATQEDLAGNASEAAEVVVVVDTVAPDAPVILAPVEGALLADATPTVRGTGEAGATVSVTIDGVPAGDALVDDDGSWTLPTTTPLADGEHVVEAVQTDAAGNASAADAVAFAVDATAPAAPVIERPADGSSTNDATPTIGGTGEPGATVAVSIDGTPVGSAPVDGGGGWSLELASPLEDGERTAVATQEDAAGNGSPPDASTFLVDTVAPAAPVIDTPADGSTTGDATPVIAGTGEPRATLSVTLDGAELGTVEVALDGTWSIAVAEPLADGTHTAAAVQSDAAGNTSEAAGSTFVIDRAAPAAPVILEPAEGAVLADATPLVSGTGEAGATVALAIDGEPVGESVVAEDGTWSVPVVAPLADGEHLAEAIQTVEGGTASGSDRSAFEVDTVAPAAPTIVSPAEGAVLADTTPPISGTGEPGARVEVRLDGEAIGTAIVDAAGSWAVPVTTALAEGGHLAEATQADAAGNVSGSAERAFEVDVTAPAAPTILAPEEGALIADPTPEVSGTGEAGATVAVRVDGAPIGEAEVGPDGAWAVPVTTPLADGAHEAVAVQADPAGNASGADSVRFEVDATTPAAPVITAPGDGTTIDDRTPAIEGTGEPGAAVEVVLDGEVLGETEVAEDGSWALPVDEPLADGPHAVEATQTDAAGNASPTAGVAFEVAGPEALPAPTITAPADGTSTSDPTPTVTGTGTPGATVVVRVDGEPVGSAIVGDDGTWELELPEALPDGPHVIDAVQSDGEGTGSAPSAPVAIVVDTVVPEAPTITSPVDGGTTGTLPVISGTGEPGSTVVVAIDGEVVGEAGVPACVDAPGDLGLLDAPGCEWELVLSDAIAAGPHVVEAWQVDAAGNESERARHAFEAVLAAPAPAPTPGGGDLPRTGAGPDAALLALAALLLLSGAWLARPRRRRA